MKRILLSIATLGLMFIGAISASAQEKAIPVQTADLNASTAPVTVTPVARYGYRYYPDRYGYYYGYPARVYRPDYYYGYYGPRYYNYGPRRYYNRGPADFYLGYRGPWSSFGFRYY